jgi:serine/threonine protein kinase
MAGLPDRVGGYAIREHIGSGSFSRVYKAFHLRTMCPVALKVFDPKNPGMSLESVQQLTQLRQNLEHPFIAQFFELFQDAGKVFIAMEFVEGGTLLKYVNEQRPLKDQEVRRLFVQILSTFDYLHSHAHIVHRDLKAENVLLDPNHNIRLVDFEFAKRFEPGGPLLSTACGSPGYVAPEVLMQEAYGPAADIWSAGVLLYLMVVGRLPFRGDNMAGLIEDILSNNPLFPSDIPPTCSQLIRRMLDKDPVTRISLPEIRLSRWIAGSIESELLASDFVLIGRLRTFDIESLDDAIATEMRALGFDLTGLVDELKSSEWTPRTTAYRILMRQRAVNDIRDWQRLKALTRADSAGTPAQRRFSKPILKPFLPAARTRSEFRANLSLPMGKFRCRKSLDLVPGPEAED